MDQPHPAIAKRLLRAKGHLEAVIEMLADGKSCVDIAQQLHAVEKAIDNAKKILIHDHIEHYLEESVAGKIPSKNRRSAEFREIVKYL